jgi:replicative DNA helicase
MTDESSKIILRFLMDIEGSSDLELASDIINSEIIQADYFYDYDPKGNEFYDNAYSSIFEACVEYFKTFATPITDSILEQQIHSTDITAKQKHLYLDSVRQIRRTPLKTAEYKYHRDAVIAGYQKSRALSIFQTAMTKTKVEPLKAIEYANRALTELVTHTDLLTDPSHTSMDLAQFARFKRKQYSEMGRFSYPCAEYGFPSFDRSLGGLFPSEITVIAGMYNTGKSFLLQEMVLHNAAKGIPTVWASLENSDNQTWVRLLAHKTRISAMKINNNDLNADEREILEAAIEELSDLQDSCLLIVPPNRAQNPLMLRNEIRRWNPETKFVGVDYINRMQSYGYRGSEAYMRVQTVLQELKTYIGQEFNAAVVTPAQLNREGTKDPTKAGLSHMQFNSINQDADNIFVLKHDPDRTWTAPPLGQYYAEPGEVFVELQRARNAPKDLMFKLEVEFTRSLVTECAHHPVSRAEQESEADGPVEEMGDDAHRPWIPPAVG